MSTINGVPVPMPGRYSGKPYNAMGIFAGPNELRDIIIDKTSIEWVASYLDQCGWIASTRSIRPRHSFAYRQMRERISGLLNCLDVKLIDPGPLNDQQTPRTAA